MFWFVSKKKYDVLKVEYYNVNRNLYIARLELKNEQAQRLKLISEIESIKQRLNRQNTQFDKQEINTLISLCHPDKHNGKKSATEMTKKLLNMR